MEDVIRVIKVDVEDNVVVKEIKTSFDTLVSEVGGWVKHVTSILLGKAIVLIVNEEGKAIGDFFNLKASMLLGREIVGDVLIAKLDKDGYTSLTIEEVSIFMEKLGGVC
jgi:hypothetical protein